MGTQNYVEHEYSDEKQSKCEGWEEHWWLVY